MDLDIKVYQAEYNQMLKDAEARKKADLANANTRFQEEKAFAEQWKKENAGALSRQLKEKAISQADYNAQLKDINATYSTFIKDANALKSNLTKEANTYFTTATTDAKSFLANQKAAIAEEQARLREQFNTQKKLSAQAQKEALANLAFERAFYTKADYDKKVAEVKNDFGRINQGLQLSFNAVQGMPAERRQEYLSGGIGSLEAAQALLARSREEAAAAPAKGSVVIPQAAAPAAPVQVATKPATPAAPVDPSIAASFLASQQAPTVTSPLVSMQQAREQVREGLITPTQQPPLSGQQPPSPLMPTQGTPFESVFGRQEQFPYLQAPVNPYMQPQQPQQPMQPPPQQPAGMQQGEMLFGAQPMQQQPQQLQTITGQTPTAQPVFPDYYQISPVTGSAQVNPYLAPYQSLLQTAQPVQEEEQPRQTAGMF
jgi:hypothetical protein